MAPIFTWIAAQPGVDAMLAIAAARDLSDLPSMPRIILKWPALPKDAATAFDYWQTAILAGKKAHHTFSALQASGFTPDLLLTASWSGAALGCAECFPNAFKVNYLEPMRFANPAEAAMRKNLQAMQIANSDLSFAFRKKDIAGISQALCEATTPAPVCVDADYFMATAHPPSQALVLLLKDLDAAELRKWLRAASRLADYDCIDNIFLVLPTKQHASEFGSIPKLTPLSTPARGQAKKIYQQKPLFIAPSPDFHQEMLEAMSCGCCVMSDCHVFRRNGTCLEVPREDLPERLLAVFGNLALRQKMGSLARKTATAAFGMDKIMPRHMETLLAGMRQAGKSSN